MKYNTLGKTGYKTSLLGFGAMRFPVIDNNPENIDMPKAMEMVHYAIDNGINYIDTAYPYHRGQSEVFLGKALKNGYREKVVLVTKSPLWMIKKQSDFDKYLDEQLKRLDTGYIDIYLFHALNEKFWNIVTEHKLLDSMVNAVKDGRIRHIGFSFHAGYGLFCKIIDSFDWDLSMVQYNYTDADEQAGVKGIIYARSRNIPVAVMEPLRGGDLINCMPNDVVEILNSAKVPKSLLEWAFGWLLGQKELGIIISGMSDLDQVKQNIGIFSQDHKFTEDDFEVLAKACKLLESKKRVKCTLCGYCDICPQNIPIAEVLHIYNSYLLFQKETSKKYYAGLIKQNKGFNSCVACKKCEEICPQSIEVISALEEADKALTEKDNL